MLSKLCLASYKMICCKIRAEKEPSDINDRWYANFMVSDKKKMN